MGDLQSYDQWLDEAAQDAFETQVTTVHAKHDYDPDQWRVCRVCGAQGDILCEAGQHSERSLCCDAPMVELIQMVCSNCGTDTETATNKCRHGVGLEAVCEMCDYENGDKPL